MPAQVIAQPHRITSDDDASDLFFYLRDAAWGGGNAGEVKLSEQVVVPRPCALALKHLPHVTSI